jgi:GntR family transcriptional regulator of vanillate catabolism
METRSQQIADILRARILDGEHLPGERLEEVPLAVQMQASRTPIRAALATLEKEGLLTYTPKRGYEVRGFSIDDIADMYKVRAVLEAHAAAECASLDIAAGDLAVLDESLRRGDEILSKGRLDSVDLPAYRDMNHRFHERILSCSRSRATLQFVTQTRQIPMLSDRIILWSDYGLILRSHDDHHRVTAAIRRGDVMRAQAVMHEHVAFMGDVVCDYIGRNGTAGHPRHGVRA